MKANVQVTIDEPWTGLEPVRIGSIPRGRSTPDHYVLVSDHGTPRLRIDAYVPASESRTFREAIVWRDWIAVGFGDRMYLVGTSGQPTVVVPLGSYFGHLYADGDRLLVASAERLVCIDAAGEIVWVTDRLGIDGVIVSGVERGEITGEGEWDPPGGWRPFTVDLETGAITSRSGQERPN